jgi:hypothetical protein
MGVKTGSTWFEAICSIGENTILPGDTFTFVIVVGLLYVLRATKKPEA